MVTKSTKQPKRLIFAYSPKGGVGKSKLVYLLAQYFKSKNLLQSTTFLDADTTRENPSTIRQLKEIVPVAALSFEDVQGRLDRDSIGEFIEAFGSNENTRTCVIDLGGKTSDYFLKYLQDPESFAVFKDLLLYYKIEPVFFCVIAGQLLTETLPEAGRLFDITKMLASSKMILANNQFFSKDSKLEQAALNEVAATFGAKVLNFQFLSQTSSEKTMASLMALISNGYDIRQRTLPPPSDDPILAKIVQEFWNEQIAPYMKVKLNYETFEASLDELLTDTKANDEVGQSN